MLKIHNSLTGKKETFTPIEPGKVGIYVCGITVYDFCHLGHARAYIVFDVVTRYLRRSGYSVNHVRNITDIDDKIIQRANENAEPFEQLTARFIKAMHEDFDALGILPPDHEPRATQSIDAIIALIEELIRKGHAYAADNGDVYYAVASFADYGKLSGKRLEDLRAGARVEVDAAKKDPLDFVLWKAAKPGEPSWESPWGQGRPGWHIECSAMSMGLLGTHFDIHGGGMDLKFPHHENEIAQSCGATGEPFANLWMHNGFVRVEEEKMSKSLGNFFTIRDVMQRFNAEEIRFLMLSSHYRKPLNYSEQELASAGASLDGFYIALSRTQVVTELPDREEYSQRFTEVMDDDFNTPGALAVLAELRRDISRKVDAGEQDEANRLAALLRQLGGVLGILQQDAEGWLKRSRPGAESEQGLSDAQIDELIARRNAARADKNWDEADRIRDQLKEAGVVLEDGAGGTGWRRG
jgi:cysteinyl-tRNA synthetase